jgi:hypothetical protein
MKHVAELMRSIDWWRLRPADGLLTSQPGGGDPAKFVAAARTPEGDLALVYLPVGGEVRIKLDQLGQEPRGTWLDPRTGETGDAESLEAKNAREAQQKAEANREKDAKENNGAKEEKEAKEGESAKEKPAAAKEATFAAPDSRDWLLVVTALKPATKEEGKDAAKEDVKPADTRPRDPRPSAADDDRE